MVTASQSPIKAVISSRISFRWDPPPYCTCTGAQPCTADKITNCGSDYIRMGRPKLYLQHISQNYGKKKLHKFRKAHIDKPVYKIFLSTVTFFCIFG